MYIAHKASLYFAALGVLLSTAACVSGPRSEWFEGKGQCGMQCASEYSTCLGRFSLTPAVHKHQCVEATKICAALCPSR